MPLWLLLFDRGLLPPNFHFPFHPFRGEPLLLHLKKALNGLRSASQEWVLYLTEIVGALGLSTCSLEPQEFFLVQNLVCCWLMSMTS